MATGRALKGGRNGDISVDDMLPLRELFSLIHLVNMCFLIPCSNTMKYHGIEEKNSSVEFTLIKIAPQICTEKALVSQTGAEKWSFKKTQLYCLDLIVCTRFIMININYA